VGHEHVRFARVIKEFMTGPMRIEDNYMKIGSIKRRVVVASVPDDDVGFGFGPLEDPAVVNSCVDDYASFN
jgi:hypothetical protein